MTRDDSMQSPAPGDGDAFRGQGIGRADLEQMLLGARAPDEDPRATFSDRWINDRGLLLDDGAVEVAQAAYLAFFTKNNSHPPVLRFEHELVTSALALFHGGRNAVGSITSGGSESLFLATAAALSAARRGRPKLDRPIVLMAESGHPAFEKYGRYLGYTVRRVPVDRDFRADPAAIARAVTDDTFMLVASVPSWTHGACDPVPELAGIAESKGLWLHVDACVGGFLAPFVRDLGRDPGAFDFAVPGVASISADFHKYGYSAKGVSGIFYRDGGLAPAQTFVFDAWAAGIYRSPVFTGTRSGGAIAAAWAVMRYLGREGYRRRAAQILELRDALVAFAAARPELRLLGRAELGTVALGGENIYAVAEQLRARGWTINRLKDPPAIQFVLGPLRDAYIGRLIADLGAAVEAAREMNGAVEPPVVVYSDEILDLPGSPVFRAGKA